MKSTPLILILTFAISLSTIPTVYPAVATTSVTSALTSLKTALKGRWNTSGTNSCDWQGVVCNPDGNIIELHLPGVGFVGPIPDNVLGNLTTLNFLSLRFNAITGSIPSDFASLSELKYLYLQHNRLTGNISDVLFKLPKLFRLDLAGNRLSGGIPAGFNNLTTLGALFLQNNQLTGEVPDLKLPNLSDFNVSYNLLTGKVPERLCSAFPATAFEGNSLSVCAFKPPSTGGGGDGDGDGDGESGNKKKKLSGGALAAIIIGCVVALLLLLLLIFCCCCRKKKNDSQPAATRSSDTEAVGTVPAAGAAAENAKGSNVEMGRGSNGHSASGVPSKTSGGANDKSLVFLGNSPRTFDLDDLLKASAEVLGKGNYGTTYKAALENGDAVAVKRLKDVTATNKEFKDKMEEIGGLQNENLVSVRAYHCSATEKLIVLDYLPMGSLSALLHGQFLPMSLFIFDTELYHVVVSSVALIFFI